MSFRAGVDSDGAGIDGPLAPHALLLLSASGPSFHDAI